MPKTSPQNPSSSESLSLHTLQQLIAKFPTPSDVTTRPPANFIDLMDWALMEFQGFLRDQTNLNKFVHNRIVIDGQFLRFCQEQQIKVEALYKDSIISWKMDDGQEKFFVQGAFRISTEKVEFLHFCLFHKGNSYEDEISFFIIVSEANYQGYIELRNAFDEWTLQEDRHNLHIRVIGGEDLPYTRDPNWDDLFLPTDLKTDIRSLVENFLAGQQFYLQNQIPWKRGFLLFGPPGNGKTSIIRTIIAQYSFKPITVVPFADAEVVQEAFAYAEAQSPALLYFEDLDSLLERSLDPSAFLNLMDGVATKNGLLVIGTANDISKLRSNITDRPSRFDRKFRLPTPDAKMSQAYLKKWFGSLISAKKYKALAKHAERYEFSYAYLKELYISSMFEALSNNRETPIETDIDKALDRLMRDRQSLRTPNPISLDQYL
jgi:ATPase family associated with various cellular activities (AAA)